MNYIHPTSKLASLNLGLSIRSLEEDVLRPLRHCGVTIPLLGNCEKKHMVKMVRLGKPKIRLNREDSSLVTDE